MSNNFVCTTCGNVDNLFATKQTSVGLECSRCITGEWHGMFAERKYDPSADNPQDFLNPPLGVDPNGALTPSF